MTRRAAKVDGNHAAIRDGLRQAGYRVFDVHSLPGRLDLDVLSKSNLVIPVEVKMPGEQLTPAELEYFECWPAIVVYSLDDALGKIEIVDSWIIDKGGFELP